ncbi:MAG: ATP-grasp domain-containing protein [Epsilonproteobacteria bacterium]|nr:ATP-grasp domain-containing protein [Campylobacterota bacterium]
MKIAISGLNATDNPAAGVGIAKSLQGHELIGFSYDPNDPANYLDIFNKKYLMPYPTLGFEELQKRLDEIRPELVIPSLDSELPLYIKYQHQLAQMGIKTFLPTAESFDIRSKNQLSKFVKTLNIKHPTTYEISSIKDITDLLRAKKISFPFMVKGNYYKAFRANSLEEAIDYFYVISNEWGFPILLQEVISGDEVNLVGLAHHGDLMGFVGIKKLTTTALGKIWSGITINNKELAAIAHQFVQATRWNGAFELECIANSSGIYLIEINPRFPSWVFFATQVGVNLPQMLVDLVNNRSVEPKFDYPLGKMYVRFTDEVVVDFQQFITLTNTKQL